MATSTCPMCTPGARGDLCLGHPYGDMCPWCTVGGGGLLCTPHRKTAAALRAPFDDEGRYLPLHAVGDGTLRCIDCGKVLSVARIIREGARSGVKIATAIAPAARSARLLGAAAGAALGVFLARKRCASCEAARRMP